MKKKIIITIVILVLLSSLVWIPLIMAIVNMFKINNFEKPIFILNESYDEETDITTYESLFYTITIQDDESVYEAIMKLHNGKIISALIADKTYDIEGNTEYSYDTDFMDEEDYAYFLKDKNKNYFIIYEGEPIKISSFLEDNSVFEQYSNGNVVNVDMAHIKDGDIREGIVTNFRVRANGDVYNISNGVLTVLTELGYEFDIEFEPDYDYKFSQEHFEKIYFLRTTTGEVLFVENNSPIVITN